MTIPSLLARAGDAAQPVPIATTAPSPAREGDPARDGAGVVRSRIVLHFPGFEPLAAADHHRRYRRSAQESARTWGLELRIDDLRQDDGAAPFFDVDCRTRNGRTASRIYIHDHENVVRCLGDRPILNRLASGFLSAGSIALQGGLHRYFLNAWRFGLFFLFPFVLIAIAGALGLSAALLVVAWTRGWGIPALAMAAIAIGALVFLWLPLLRRMHVPLLLSDWTFALMLGRLDDARCRLWLDDLAARVRPAFDEDCDEFVVSSHSMGSNVAVHVLGLLLEREPDLLEGKRVAFVSMGGALLQCALLRSAGALRARVGTIARQTGLDWIDVQCLTDPVSFYGSKVVSAAGHPQAPQARIVAMRIRKMLSAQRYRRIRWQFLRRHRQYVLGSDKRHRFDFTCLTAGPLPASATGRGMLPEGYGMEPVAAPASRRHA